MENKKTNYKFQTGSGQVLWRRSSTLPFDREKQDEEEKPSIFKLARENYNKRRDAAIQTEEESKPAVRGRFDGLEGSTISAPTGNETKTPTLPKLDRADEMFRKNEELNRNMGKGVRDFARKELGRLGKFFFGESEDSFRFGEPDSNSYRNIDKIGQEKGFFDSTRDDIKSRGVVRWLYQNILMEEPEKVKLISAEMQRQGYSRAEAINVTTRYFQGGEDSVEDVAAVEMIKTFERNRKAWAMVELLDVSPIFSGFVKQGSKTYIRQTLERALAVENAKESRKIILEALPDLKGTKALDDVVGMTQTMRDPAQGEALLKEIVRTADQTPAGATTEAQKIIYENGVPVIRAGRASENVGDIVNVRDEIRSAVKGEMEGRRLSGDDVLNDEIRAGILKFGTDANSTVPVFTTRNVGKLSLGERVALDPTIARESLEAGGDAREVIAKVDDLVRLDDGTFVYAPKKAVTEGFSPQIKAVQDKMRQKTIEAEKRRTQLARDIKVAERQEAEMIRREARLKAEEVLKKRARDLRIAKETVTSGVEELSKLKSKIDTETKSAVKERVTARKEATTAISEKQTQLNKLLKNLQRVRDARQKLPETYKKKIEDIRSGAKKVRVGKEDLPENIENQKVAIQVAEEAIENHPAKGLGTFAAKKGEFRGLLPEEAKGLDEKLSEITDGAYETLEEARFGYQDYLNQKSNLKSDKVDLREGIAEWKDGATKRIGGRTEAAKVKAIKELQAEKIAKSKELMKSEDGLKKGVSDLEGGIAKVKESNPDINKTVSEIRKEISAPAQARKKNLAKDTARRITTAKIRLKEAGIDSKTVGTAEPSSFEAARQWISGGNRRGMTQAVVDDLDAAAIKPKESLTLYRIGDVDSSKFQSWSKEKPTNGEDFTEKTFTPEQMLIDTTDSRFVSKFSGGELDAIKMFNKRESEVIIKAEKKITAKQVDEINNAQTTNKEVIKEVKEFEKSVPSTPKRNFDPIESDGKVLETKMNADIARRTGYEEGIPKEYRQMNLAKDQQNAVKMVIEDVMDIYNRFIEGEDFTKATRASIGNALISHPQIASSPFRLDEVYRGLQGTRQAQEFVARRNIGDLDVVNFINSLNKRGEDILAKRGINLKNEVEAAWKAAGLEKATNQKAISRKSVEKVLKNNLC